ncbi:SARP family transcriptional regulator [Sphaerisporangium melleum]|uniref:SARP family transcriptional regulator n=1 Tax=Sphaerisporangium melleum TaxID=321316 RepID=A0A917R419_9ACTN|nr:BTAD domain-containing putative transcriptional regulator [Sphaerisporangium melleum]GGK89414.1 SARP family transcriptional regulator [Sphaerisporangium melleum]GII72494.1 SARP family transcriptional regulator [Sphaerisporangium melleum]
MQFGILGALEATAADRRLDLGGIRQQIVLATLLLDANRVVTIGRLMEAIYGDEPPTTARSQVQICISALRRLFAANGSPDIISTQSLGYCIRVAADQIDVQRFDSLVQRARRARESRNLNEAIRYYREALALWRGPALDGIESTLVQTSASRLAEDRISANEDCIQLELDLGRHHELVGELTELTEEHPLRERLRGLLMTALYRSGRQAEALQVYRNARRTMIEELGIEPNERLQQLEHAILTSDESLAAPPPPPARAEVRPPPVSAAPPAAGMLPTDIADFTGRTAQIEDIRRRLVLAAEDRSRFAVPIIVIVGKPGVGKTTIAVHASHAVGERFPHGQLFADLHGAASRPTSPMQVLERFLRVLGVAGTAIPDGMEERAEMYRALLADRKMLIVLDDAGSESQVLPLLPGSPSSAVIMTARTRLAGLAGAVHVDVNTFDSGQSVDLLSHIAGTERVQSEIEAAEALADMCGHLPLALRIAGARLSARPHWSIEQLVSRLADETRRLDELKHGDMAIRASISLTYDSVSEDARRLFRRLTILDSQIFSAWVSAALLDQPLPVAQDLLDDLADAQLIETTGIGYGVHSQYRFHDLIRVFARERLAAEETPAERNAALERVLGGLLFLAEAAHRREYGGDYVQIHSDARRYPLPDPLVTQLVASPLQWYERERSMLVSGIRQAAQAGLVPLCWDLAISSVTLFESRVYLDDWRETHQVALAAARQAIDMRGQAAMLYSRGSLYITEQRFGDARCDFEAALQLFEDVGDHQGTALVIRNIGFLDRLSGRFADAEAHYRRALEIFHANGDQVASAYVLHNLAQLRLEFDDLPGAQRMLSEALELSRRSGSRRVEAQVLHRIGHTYLQSDRPARAVEVFEEALAAVRNIGDPTGEAYALHGLGVARMRRGELAECESALTRALMLASTSSEHLVEARVQLGLGELAMTRHDATQAVVYLEQALSLFRQMNMPLQEARTLMRLSDAQQAAGDEDAAHDSLHQALILTDKMDAPVAEQMRAQLNQRLSDSR